MKIKKQKGTFNDYTVEMSYGQLLAVKNALGADHADPVSDELFAELDWYLDNIPGPGEDEEDLKAAEEAGDSGMASPEAAGQPLKPKADDLLPLPGGEGGGEAEGPPGGSEAGEEPGGGEAEGPPGGSEEEEEPESEADRRLPPPPGE